MIYKPIKVSLGLKNSRTRNFSFFDFIWLENIYNQANN